MGMALDESTDKLHELESNGIKAFIDPKVVEYIKQFGNINIDYVIRDDAQGYVIKVGDADCSASGCKGCG